MNHAQNSLQPRQIPTMMWTTPTKCPASRALKKPIKVSRSAVNHPQLWMCSGSTCLSLTIIFTAGGSAKRQKLPDTETPTGDNTAQPLHTDSLDSGAILTSVVQKLNDVHVDVKRAFAAFPVKNGLLNVIQAQDEGDSKDASDDDGQPADADAATPDMCTECKAKEADFTCGLQLADINVWHVTGVCQDCELDSEILDDPRHFLHVCSVCSKKCFGIECVFLGIGDGQSVTEFRGILVRSISSKSANVMLCEDERYEKLVPLEPQAAMLAAGYKTSANWQDFCWVKEGTGLVRFSEWLDKRKSTLKPIARRKLDFQWRL